MRPLAENSHFVSNGFTGRENGGPRIRRPAVPLAYKPFPAYMRATPDSRAAFATAAATALPTRGSNALGII